MNTETSTQTPAHEFLISGCRFQWRGDHDHADCWAAFLRFNGAPAGLTVSEFYDRLLMTVE